MIRIEKPSEVGQEGVQKKEMPPVEAAKPGTWVILVLGILFACGSIALAVISAVR